MDIRSVEETKKKLLNKLLCSIKTESLSLIWKDSSDFHGQDLGAEVLYTSFDKFKEVRVISLYKPSKGILHSSCLSIAYGCNKNCPICKSGTEETFMGYYDYRYIVAQQEFLMRHSSYYDDSFWTDESPFSTALTGQGDIAFNFDESMKAMDILESVFGKRFICNISTAFIMGVEKLLNFLTGTNFIPNLQISLHGSNKEIRRHHVDSDEDPKLLVQRGLEYAKQSDTVLIVNYGLTDKNFRKEYIEEVLDWLDPKISRMKFSRINLSKSADILSVQDDESFELAACWAKGKGINYEIFDERFQAGLESGAACGTLLNRIPIRQKEVSEDDRMAYNKQRV